MSQVFIDGESEFWIPRHISKESQSPRQAQCTAGYYNEYHVYDGDQCARSSAYTKGFQNLDGRHLPGATIFNEKPGRRLGGDQC